MCAAAITRTLVSHAEKRECYQEMYAAGMMTLGELSAKMAALEEDREAAEAELDAISEAGQRIEGLRRHKRAVLELFGTGLSFGLEYLPPELRIMVYSALGLRATVDADNLVHLEGEFDADVLRYTAEVEAFAERLREADERLREAGGTPEALDRELQKLSRFRKNSPTHARW